MQEAIAIGLELELERFGQPDSYLVQKNQTMMKKRDSICAVLKEVGLKPTVPDGGYFVLADATGMGKEFDTDKEPYDLQFVKWLAREKVFVMVMQLVSF